MTLDVDGLREHVESSLSDDALGLLLDAAYETIDALIGPPGYDDAPASVTEVLTGVAGPLFMLAKPAEAITLITEHDTELAEDDYRMMSNQLVMRLDTGTNSRRSWYRRIIVTYEPVSDAATRDRVAVALVKLELDHQPGVSAERLGDHSISFGSGSSYTEDRDAILASLTPGGFMAK